MEIDRSFVGQNQAQVDERIAFPDQPFEPKTLFDKIVSGSEQKESAYKQHETNHVGDGLGFGFEMSGQGEETDADRRSDQHHEINEDFYGNASDGALGLQDLCIPIVGHLHTVRAGLTIAKRYFHEIKRWNGADGGQKTAQVIKLFVVDFSQREREHDGDGPNDDQDRHRADQHSLGQNIEGMEYHGEFTENRIGQLKFETFQNMERGLQNVPRQYRANDDVDGNVTERFAAEK